MRHGRGAALRGYWCDRGATLDGGRNTRQAPTSLDQPGWCHCKQELLPCVAQAAPLRQPRKGIRARADRRSADPCVRPNPRAHSAGTLVQFWRCGTNLGIANPQIGAPRLLQQAPLPTAGCRADPRSADPFGCMGPWCPWRRAELRRSVTQSDVHGETWSRGFGLQLSCSAVGVSRTPCRSARVAPAKVVGDSGIRARRWALRGCIRARAPVLMQRAP